MTRAIQLNSGETLTSDQFRRRFANIAYSGLFPSADYLQSIGASIVDLPPAPITPAQVIAERSRRLALGFDYDFADTRGVHRIGTTPDDMRGWDEVTTWASAAIALGNSSSTLQILTDTGPVTVTALEWQSILAAATAFRQPIWGASFALQAMDPIPQDYAAAEYWP